MMAVLCSQVEDLAQHNIGSYSGLLSEPLTWDLTRNNLIWMTNPVPEVECSTVHLGKIQLHHHKSLFDSTGYAVVRGVRLQLGAV